MQFEECSVHCWGKKAGTLFKHNNQFYFEYDKEWKFSLSPKMMPLNETGTPFSFPGDKHQHGLPGVIYDSLPGEHGLKYMDRFFERHKRPKPGIIDRLLFIGNRSVGALSYEPSEIYNRQQNEVVFSLHELYLETRRSVEGEYSDMLDILITWSNSGAAGARAKALVGYNPENGMIKVSSEPHRAEEDFIPVLVKFNEYYNHVPMGVPELFAHECAYGITEYVYSILAKEAGIRMPDTYLIQSHEGFHFAVKRFDVLQGAEKLHMHSYAGLRHYDSGDRYAADYRGVFEMLDFLEAPYEDKEQAYRIMCFNYFFANRDDHSGNIGFTMDMSGLWRLAPAYDLTFVVNKSRAQYHQMGFFRKEGTAITVNELLETGKKIGISGAKKILSMMHLLSMERLPTLLREYALSEEWISHVQKHLPSNTKKSYGLGFLSEKGMDQEADKPIGPEVESKIKRRRNRVRR